MNQEVNSSVKKRNKFYGLLIIAAIVLPMVLAYIIFKTGIGFPAGTTNKGQLLIPPQAIQDLVLNEKRDVVSALYSFASISDQSSESPSVKKRWRILVPVTQACGEVCQGYLYLTRQVHIRLAEKAYRVERMLLLLDPLSESEMESLKKEHPSTLIIKSTSQNVKSWLSDVALPSEPKDYFYLVDQEGFVMMRYDTSHNGQDLLDDVKKLLKFTYAK